MSEKRKFTGEDLSNGWLSAKKLKELNQAKLSGQKARKAPVKVKTPLPAVLERTVSFSEIFKDSDNSPSNLVTKQTNIFDFFKPKLEDDDCSDEKVKTETLEMANPTTRMTDSQLDRNLEAIFGKTQDDREAESCDQEDSSLAMHYDYLKNISSVYRDMSIGSDSTDAPLIGESSGCDDELFNPTQINLPTTVDQTADDKENQDTIPNTVDDDYLDRINRSRDSEREVEIPGNSALIKNDKPTEIKSTETIDEAEDVSMEEVGDSFDWDNSSIKPVAFVPIEVDSQFTFGEDSPVY